MSRDEPAVGRTLNDGNMGSDRIVDVRVTAITGFNDVPTLNGDDGFADVKLLVLVDEGFWKFELEAHLVALTLAIEKRLFRLNTPHDFHSENATDNAAIRGLRHDKA